MVWSKRILGSVAVMAILGLVVLPALGRDDADDEDETEIASLTTLGVVSAAYLYQAHLTIGLLADAHAKEVYSKEKCSQLQQVNIQLLNLTKKQFGELAKKGDLDEDDAKSIKEFGKLSELLRKEAQTLEAFWKSGGEEELKAYNKAREVATKRIGRLFEK